MIESKKQKSRQRRLTFTRQALYEETTDKRQSERNEVPKSTALGAYRAFVTDPHQTVVLHFPTRTVVVSPSAPEEFVQDIRVTSHAV